MTVEDVSYLPPAMRAVYSSIVDQRSSLNALGAVQQFRLALQDDNVDQDTRGELEMIFAASTYPNVGANAYGVCLLVAKTMKAHSVDGI